MPHRRGPMNAKSAGANGALHRGKGDNWQTKDTTSVHEGTEEYGPQERKSAPSPWRRLSDVLAEAVGDELLRELLEAGRQVDAEPGDGAAAFLPGGEVLLFHVAPDGLLVRRNVAVDDVALFLAGAREAA